MSTPAGWYDDGVTPGRRRWWDGAQWTDDYEPDPAAPQVAPPVVQAAAAQPAYQPNAYVQAAAAPRRPLSKNAKLAIIIAGAVALVVAILLIILGATGVLGGGGGGAVPHVSAGQEAVFLDEVDAAYLSDESDVRVLEGGYLFCEIANGYTGSVASATQLQQRIDSEVAPLAGFNPGSMNFSQFQNFAYTYLCPQVQARLQQLGPPVG